MPGDRGPAPAPVLSGARVRLLPEHRRRGRRLPGLPEGRSVRGRYDRRRGQRARRGRGDHGNLLRGAGRWLLDAQHEDGTFKRSWSLSEANTIWRAMWALHSLPEAAHTALKARIARASAASRRFLADAQNSDGGWGFRPEDPSDLASTCYSLLALSALGRRVGQDAVVRAGVGRLLTLQKADGRHRAARPARPGRCCSTRLSSPTSGLCWPCPAATVTGTGRSERSDE
ncbi:prenyltransferase/squalene oxidase repeat-containing protein [Streptomyces rimosus]|uniref:prenyltransferase/squalene oxidase repeat-containing protein n=1 Tax=Streptomyces rimosus TaxID=1927 RepID=UPI000D145BAB